MFSESSRAGSLTSAPFVRSGYCGALGLCLCVTPAEVELLVERLGNLSLKGPEEYEPQHLKCTHSSVSTFSKT